MLYPEARYFTPNGTCKNSICWNGPWNMSALAEGSLAVLELAVWLWGSCVVSCTPWAERGERDAAMAVWQQGCGSRSLHHLSESPRGKQGGWRERERERERDPIITWSPYCWMSVWWRDCKSPLLNVTKGAIRIQLWLLLWRVKTRMASKLLDRCASSWCKRKVKRFQVHGSFTVGKKTKNKTCMCLYVFRFWIIIWACLKISL